MRAERLEALIAAPEIKPDDYIFRAAEDGNGDPGRDKET